MKLGKVESPVCHVVPELWRGMGRLVGTCHEAASLFLVAASGVTILFCATWPLRAILAPRVPRRWGIGEDAVHFEPTLTTHLDCIVFTEN